jgi:UDP-N-acetylmuramoylalanine--D-glutamate ligase
MAVAAGIDVGVGGNLGLPVLDMLRTRGEQQLYVLELSSFQLETTSSLKAAVSVILNISEDHMDRYSSMQEYVNAKQRIFNGCAQYVVNRDDALTSPETAAEKAWISFGLDKPAQGQFGIRQQAGENWLALGDTYLLPVSAMKIRGNHNVANALAALALGQAIQLPMSAMVETLKTFAGLPHRCELVAEKEGVAWYNDSKGTNVGSTLAAIRGLGTAISGKLILIAGGVGKGQDFTPLSDPLKLYARALVLIGDDGGRIAEAVDTAVHREFAESLADALLIAKNLAQPGDAIVLSPACASFDMFKNYEDRGQKFVSAVHALVGA